MNLLTFAHRGEAQYFLEKDNFTTVDFQFNGLYKNKNNYLLLSGEGLNDAAKVISAFFNTYPSEIENIINLGIAGALSKNLEIEKIYSIKEIRREYGSETFQTADVYATVDCISAENRVYNKIYKEQLGKHAQIVDRELWANAKVADSFSKKIYAYKLISDFADNNVDINTIKLKAKDFSKKFYQFYQTVNF